MGDDSRPAGRHRPYQETGRHRDVRSDDTSRGGTRRLGIERIDNERIDDNCDVTGQGHTSCAVLNFTGIATDGDTIEFTLNDGSLGGQHDVAFAVFKPDGDRIGWSGGPHQNGVVTVASTASDLGAYTVVAWSHVNSVEFSIDLEVKYD